MAAPADSWDEINAAVRAGIARRAQAIDVLSPDELHSLTVAIETALTNEIRAAAYEEAVEAQKRMLEREATFGG